MSTANAIGGGHNPGTEDDEDWDIRVGAEAYEDEAKAQSFSLPDNFWLKVGSESKLVFVDRDYKEGLPSIDLHGFFPTEGGKDGKTARKRFEPCLAMKWTGKALAEKGFRVAPCCQVLGPISQSMDRNTAFQTVVDGSKFTDRNGNTRQFELKLYPINKGVKKLLDMKYNDWDNRLHGWVIKVQRPSDKSPRVGGSFEREISKEGMVVSKDYESMFKVVMFRGKLLSKLWDDAETEIKERDAKIAELTATLKETTDAAQIADINKNIARLKEPGDWTRYVTHYFRVKIIDGKIVTVDRDGRPMSKNRTIPVFNYKKVFKPKDPVEFQRLYAHMIDNNMGDTPEVKTGTGAPTRGSEAADDLPF